MALIFGIGVGLFILIIVWTVTVLLSLVFTKTEKLRPAAGGLVFVAALLTLIVVLYPREGSMSELADVVVTDKTFWGRVTMLAVISFFTLLCLIFLLIFHWTELIAARPIKSR